MKKRIYEIDIYDKHIMIFVTASTVNFHSSMDLCVLKCLFKKLQTGMFEFDGARTQKPSMTNLEH